MPQMLITCLKKRLRGTKRDCIALLSLCQIELSKSSGEKSSDTTVDLSCLLLLILIETLTLVDHMFPQGPAGLFITKSCLADSSNK